MKVANPTGALAQAAVVDALNAIRNKVVAALADTNITAGGAVKLADILNALLSVTAGLVNIDVNIQVPAESNATLTQLVKTAAEQALTQLAQLKAVTEANAVDVKMLQAKLTALSSLVFSAQKAGVVLAPDKINAAFNGLLSETSRLTETIVNVGETMGVLWSIAQAAVEAGASLDATQVNKILGHLNNSVNLAAIDSRSDFVGAMGAALTVAVLPALTTPGADMKAIMQANITAIKELLGPQSDIRHHIELFETIARTPDSAARAAQPA